eukprot:gene19311-21235_t
MKDLGGLKNFVEINFSKSGDTISMSQEDYVVKILRKFGMENCKPRATPCELNPNAYDSNEPVDHHQCQHMIGSLIYAMIVDDDLFEEDDCKWQTDCRRRAISVSSRKTAFLVGDFEPLHIGGITGTYGTYARVIPNVEGVFMIAIVNVNSDDVELPPRKTIRFLHPAGSDAFVVSGPNTTTCATTPPAPPQQYQMGAQLSVEERDRLSSLIDRYEDIFATNPKRPQRNTVLEHKIITNISLPVYQKPRHIPAAWENEVDTQVHEMLDNDIIRPSELPWNSPIILVKKKDNSTRFVCDFRKLNDTTKKDTYPLPHIKDLLDKMAGAWYWSTLDAASAYWSMPLHKEDKEKTAFSVPRGTFEFNVTPYGLCNAGASYQRLMDICLSGLPADHILAYMDDIAVYSTTFDEHLKDLETVFLRLRSAGISLKASNFPRCGEPFIVEVDASDTAVGGVLSQQQQQDGTTHPITIPLSIYERNAKDPRGKFARWISELGEYNYTIQYLPVKLNIKADALSRFSSKLQKQDSDPFDDLFEEKIYAIDASNQSFKAQLIKEQNDDPVIGPAKRSHAAQDLHDNPTENAPTIPTEQRNKPDGKHPARENRPTQIIAEDTFSSSDESESEDTVPEHNRRYPLRQHRQRVVEGGIPWNNIRDFA